MGKDENKEAVDTSRQIAASGDADSDSVAELVVDQESTDSAYSTRYNREADAVEDEDQ